MNADIGLVYAFGTAGQTGQHSPGLDSGLSQVKAAHNTLVQDICFSYNKNGGSQLLYIYIYTHIFFHCLIEWNKKNFRLEYCKYKIYLRTEVENTPTLEIALVFQDIILYYFRSLKSLHQ